MPAQKSLIDRVGRLAEYHATLSPPLSKVQFLDHFELDTRKNADGYTATELYHIYLAARIYERRYRCADSL
ncbi:hypothetical protein GCM10018965_055650 [Nonomuraea roseola]